GGPGGGGGGPPSWKNGGGGGCPEGGGVRGGIASATGARRGGCEGREPRSGSRRGESITETEECFQRRPLRRSRPYPPRPVSSARVALPSSIVLAEIFILKVEAAIRAAAEPPLVRSPPAPLSQSGGSLRLRRLRVVLHRDAVRRRRARLGAVHRPSWLEADPALAGRPLRDPQPVDRGVEHLLLFVVHEGEGLLLETLLDVIFVHDPEMVAPGRGSMVRPPDRPPQARIEPAWSPHTGSMTQALGSGTPAPAPGRVPGLNRENRGRVTNWPLPFSVTSRLLDHSSK